MPVTIRSVRSGSGFSRHLKRFCAAGIPEIIAFKNGNECLPYSMLAKEWDWWPEDREHMVAERPVSDSHDDLCRIAAVVHCLCARDKVAVPGWVWDYRSERPLLLLALPAVGGIYERARAEALPPCGYHNVWFSYRTIEPLSEAARRWRRERRRRRWWQRMRWLR